MVTHNLWYSLPWPTGVKLSVNVNCTIYHTSTPRCVLKHVNHMSYWSFWKLKEFPILRKPGRRCNWLNYSILCSLVWTHRSLRLPLSIIVKQILIVNTCIKKKATFFIILSVSIPNPNAKRTQELFISTLHVT